MHYHAHIYFEPSQREIANQLWSDIGYHHRLTREFYLEPIGPHPKPMMEVDFEQEDGDLSAGFGRFVSWLMLNRQGLSVFIHPHTGDSLKDHTENALWLGEQISLKLDQL